MPELTAETFSNISTAAGLLSLVIVALIMLHGLGEVITSITIGPRDDE